MMPSDNFCNGCMGLLIQADVRFMTSCPCLSIEPPASGGMGYLARLASKSKPGIFERKLFTGSGCFRYMIKSLDQWSWGSSCIFSDLIEMLKKCACPNVPTALPHPRRKSFSKLKRLSRVCYA